MNCSECVNHLPVPGEWHVQCANPPTVIDNSIGRGGMERYQIAQERAARDRSVVRCIWPGSGSFPSCYDANTVFGCCNFKPFESGKVEETK